MRGWAAARVVLVVLAAVAVLAVVAVGTYWLVRAWQSEEPVPLPTPTVTSSPVPTSGTAAPSTGPATTAPTPPPFPPEASAETAEGAVAFVEWWFAELSYAYATGDTARLRAYSTTSCTACDSLLVRVESAYSSGGSIESDSYRLQFEEARAGAPRSWVVDLLVDSPRLIVVANDGSTIEQFDAGEGERARATVLWEEAREPLMAAIGERQEDQ